PSGRLVPAGRMSSARRSVPMTARPRAPGSRRVPPPARPAHNPQPEELLAAPRERRRPISAPHHPSRPAARLLSPESAQSVAEAAIQDDAASVVSALTAIGAIVERINETQSMIGGVLTGQSAVTRDIVHGKA